MSEVPYGSTIPKLQVPEVIRLAFPPDEDMTHRCEGMAAL